MGLSKNKKAIKRLRERADNTIFISAKIGGLAFGIPNDIAQDALEVANDILLVIDAYEKQIELNKRQNIKIKNQRGIIKALQRKQGDKI